MPQESFVQNTLGLYLGSKILGLRKASMCVCLCVCILIRVQTCVNACINVCVKVCMYMGQHRTK